MQATVIKTIKETVGGSTLIYQKEFFVHSSPSKFFFGQTRVRRIIFNNTAFISLQMINRPHIRRKPFRTPTTDQRIKFRFITRNQAQHQCNERQQEELSFHNNNSSTPVPGRATNKQKSVGTVLSPVPRLEALVCPTLSERATQNPTPVSITIRTHPMLPLAYKYTNGIGILRHV